MNTLSLPYGLTARALTMDDAGAVFEVAALQEQHDIGKVEIEAADIVADWQRPSFDVGSQTIGLFDGGTMVGYGEITDHDRDDAAVHPSYRRRFEPWNFRVVADASGQIVGTALVVMYGDPATEAFIDRLAVRRDQRRQGLGQALLVDAFALGREHGATRSALSTDSRTGALSLYQKVGMEVTEVWVNRVVDL